jgi:hypothetical protein
MKNVALYCGRLEYFINIGYILWEVGNLVVIWHIFPALVYCTKKNLATLHATAENIANGT